MTKERGLPTQWDTSTFTTEFGHEFEADRGRWLRRRFVWYTGIVGGALVLLGLIDLIVRATGSPVERPSYAHFAGWCDVGVSILTGVLFLAALAYVRTKRQWEEQPLRIVYWLIVANGVLALVSEWLELRAGARIVDGQVVAEAGSVGLSWTYKIVYSHVLASLFLPWTPREAFRPMVPLLGLCALFILVYVEAWWAKGLLILCSPFLAFPGMLICWLRHSRYRERFALSAIRGRYTEMKRELVDARRIHESLFPPPILAGPLRFSYRYEPMRQIGGDYLYAFVPPAAGPGGRDTRSLTLIIVDVTGHGIPAALTVNRLHGELDRIYAEQPDTGPGEVLTLLNRYVHLTLATHSVYVTAFCVRADAQRGILEYASGGHPPAFIRGVDGTVEQLDSTSFVLGACAAADFEAEPRSRPFGPGDSLVIYTDGAIESRDAKGKFFGVIGLQKIVAMGKPDPSGGWPAAILSAVHRHRFGPPADDTLVVEIHRPLGSEAAAPKSAAVSRPVGASRG